MHYTINPTKRDIIDRKYACQLETCQNMLTIRGGADVRIRSSPLSLALEKKLTLPATGKEISKALRIGGAVKKP
ncbi:hypothetical protein ACLB2K_029142 [Fragaria x ananassa]